MRNLKKVLSLSLALVMLLGMMVVGAGAATALNVYSDANDITYKEAVDLLTAIDVLQGDDGGFRPTDTLTREQAAKIVATVALGVDAAEALNVASAPFTDVAATRWSAGYIAYCANVGIINGMGDGTYHPTDEVTGYQFAKMLLCVLGYGANDEYVGSNWSLNVATDGVTTGLFSRLSNVGKNPATREEAAQLAFNALGMDMVSYSTLYGTYSAYTGVYGNQQLLGTKANKIFNVESKTFTDDLGYGYRYWKLQNRSAAITDNYLTDEVIGTVTTGTGGAMFRAYDFASDLVIYENGNLITATSYALGATTLSEDGSNVYSAADLQGKNTNVITYNGQKIDVIDSNGDGDADKLIVVTEYLAEVTRVTAATSSAGRSVTLRVYLPNSNSTITTTLETDNYAVGDYILVTPSGTLSAIKAASSATALGTAFGSVVDHAAAEVVSAGTVTAYYAVSTSQAGSVTTGGARYSYNGVFNADDGATTPALLSEALGSTLAESGYGLNSATYDFYLDSQGNVIGAVEVEGSISDFAYIQAVGTDSFGMHNIVKAILSDGTVGTYTVTSNSVASAYQSASTVGTSNTNDKDGYARVGEIYTYSVSGSNITLRALTGRYESYISATDVQGTTIKTAASATTRDGFFTKGYTSILFDNNGNTVGGNDVAYANANTVFIYVDPANGAMTRYVGYANAPSYTGDNSDAISIAYHTVGTSTSKIADLVVIGAAAPAAAMTSYLYVYSENIVGTSLDTDGDTVFYYNVIKDGEVTRVATDDTLSNGVGVYAYAVNTAAFAGDGSNNVEAGRYTLGNPSGTDSGVISVNTNDSVIVLASGQNYIIGSDCDVTDISNTRAIVTGASFEVGDTVTLVYTTSGSSNNIRTVQAMYITAHSGSSGDGNVVYGNDSAVVALTSADEGTVTVERTNDSANTVESLVRSALTGVNYTVNSVSITTSVDGIVGYAYATAGNGNTVTFEITLTNLYKVTLGTIASGLTVTLGSDTLVAGDSFYVDETAGKTLTVAVDGGVTLNTTPTVDGGVSASTNSGASPYSFTVTATAVGTLSFATT